jgi:CheY-like chemotaxis protein
MAPYIVIVEDDHLQEGPLQEYLGSAVPDADIETIGTELEFRRRLPALRERVPHVVVMDVMLRWTFPAPDAVPPPEDVATGGYYRAGLRCARLLADDPRLAAVPVILYTILERSDLERGGQTLPENSTYLGKTAELDVLSRKVRGLLQTRTR